MEKKSNLELLSEVVDKTTVSARVNSYIVEQYKNSEIPISLVIETSLINFMKLEDEEKIKFISKNLPEKVSIKEIKKPAKKWKDMLGDYFKKLNIPATVTSGLVSGVCIGAVALIGGILTTLGDKFFDEK